jgi:hypothetical protein
MVSAYILLRLRVKFPRKMEKCMVLGGETIKRWFNAQENVLASRTIMMAVAGLLAALTLILHGSALQGFWRFDDTAILLYVVEHPSVLGYFFSPGQWRASGVPFFTPWLIFDYWLDFTLFGLKPVVFYAHHLAVVWLAALLTFVLLYRHAGLIWSGMGATLFLAGAPVGGVAQQIMTRHYATGLVFAILSILFWRRAHEQKSRISLALSTCLYLLAMLNKEIFAPLPLVLFFLQTGALKSRLDTMFPLGLSIVIFVVWRSAMLGAVIGGYGGLDAAADLPQSLAALPMVFFGVGYPALATCVVVLSTACLALYLIPHHIPLVLAMLVALLLPFLAIRVSVQPFDLRFAFLPWWGSCVLLALGFSSLFRRRQASEAQRFIFPCKIHYLVLMATLAAVSATLSKSRDTARAIDAIVTFYDVQGRFMWSHKETVSYVPQGDLSGFGLFGYGTSALKNRLLKQNSPIAVPFAEYAVKFGVPLPVYSYNLDCRCMKEALRTVTASIGKDGFQPSLPIAIHMNRTPGRLDWYIQAPGAACFMVFREINTSTTVPCSGRVSFDLPPWLKGKFTLVVRTQEQQWNASPMLVFPEKGATLVWDSSGK